MGRRKQDLQIAKPKSRGKIVLLVISLLLLAVIVMAVIYCYPKWKTAKDFENYLDFSGFSYEMEIELDRDAMGREQTEMMGLLARLMDIDADAMYRLHISGAVYRNIIYAEIYADGMETPIIRVYLSDGEDMADIGFLYSCFRSKIVGDSQFLDVLIPSVEGSAYLSVQQLEQLLHMDFGSIRKFNTQLDRYQLSAPEYFIILAALPYVRQTEESELILSEYIGSAEASDGQKTVTAHVSVKKPSLIVEQNADFLSKLGVFFDSAKIKSVKSLSIDVTSDEVKELVIPKSGVSQETIDVLSTIGGLWSK